MRAKIANYMPPLRYTAAMIHNEMGRIDRHFSGLLKGLPFIGFVGCQENLAGALAAHFGIPQHQTYLVPGEYGRNQLPESQRKFGHFPKIYRNIVASIVVPYHGAVFLVAAGLLGKLYCARIKELGGIAIDVGSLADAWMGFNTRPGQYDDIAAWRIPS